MDSQTELLSYIRQRREICRKRLTRLIDSQASESEIELARIELLKAKEDYLRAALELSSLEVK